MRKLHKFPGGLKLSGFKELSSTAPSLPPIIPEHLVFPLDQHIGTLSVPIVQAGEKVLKGQQIASSSSYVSTTIHASSSGTVIALDEAAITIKTDGEDRWGERMIAMDYVSASNEQLEQRIADAGIIGMGGAGFPSQVKVKEGAGAQVEILIINGVECEPYITCDDRLIRECSKEIIGGAKILQKVVAAESCVLATEDDMLEAYEALKEAAGEELEVVKVPAIYPAGGEKQLIQTITGKSVPSHSLPVQVSALVQNVATAAAIYRAVVFGEPLVSRIVTLSGDIKQPCNIEVLNGTPVAALLTQIDAIKKDEVFEQVLMGGPMMGIEIQIDDSIVTKKTSCLLIRKKQTEVVESSCIRCGDCVDVCPMKLQPQMLFSLARSEQWDELDGYSLFDCIECGCCDHVCPSHIPLVSYYKQAKSALQAQDKAMQRAAQGKERYAEHLQRQEINDMELLEARVKKKATELRKDNLQSEVLAAISRTKARRNDPHS